MRVLTAEEMRNVDRAASEEIGIPSLVLMENAAIGVADAIGEVYPKVNSAGIFCGPGNNGGDGLALGRQLAARGYQVEIFLVGGAIEPAGDAGVQLAICRRLELPLHEVADGAALRAALDAARELDLVVDALFGTGLGRPLAGLYAAAAEGLNRLGRPCVAVDLPSGLSGSRAEPLGPHVEADLTVTFAAPKVAHVLPPASQAVGELVVADLGFPRRLVDAAPGDLHLLAGEDLATLLPPRAPDSHKGTYGHLLLVAGSTGKAGAAVLAARAAVRAGAGLVTAAVPEPVLAVVSAGSVESMTLPLPAGEAGQLAAAAADLVLAAAAGRNVLAIGPGLGQQPETAAAIRRIVLETALPAVVDADGLNAFAGRAGELRGRRAPTVLTPHPGELGRLLGIAAAEVQADRPAAARRAAAETGAIVVLKGHLTLVADPAGGLYINPTGNPGMATGGTGDVLTGILGGLAAQRLRLLAAAQLGVYLHGLAGDVAVQSRGERGLAAADLIEALPVAFSRLGQ
jgi:hydroxyethylthiazole kinase-like uncharacterized protein yjeF